MAYRATRQVREKMAAMRAAREAKRLAAEPPDYPAPLPELRRRITIEDFDGGERRHVLELYRTDRIDCYRCVVDGVEWKKRIGWTRVLAGLRKSLPRVRAMD